MHPFRAVITHEKQDMSKTKAIIITNITMKYMIDQYHTYMYKYGSNVYMARRKALLYRYHKHNEEKHQNTSWNIWLINITLMNMAQIRAVTINR